MGDKGEYECCAASPLGFSLQDWWVITRLSFAEISQDNVSIVSAGVAFFSMLAIFPMITAGLSIYGLFADPAVAQEQLYAISDILPEDVWVLINDQVQAGYLCRALGIRGGYKSDVWRAQYRLWRGEYA